MTNMTQGGLSVKERRLYNIWHGMIQRCENPKRDKYKSYGARGISVCDEWHDFKAFVDWAYSNGYQSDSSIERINNNAGYCPENCKWADRFEQANNQRRSKKIVCNGVVGSAPQWSRLLGISKNTIYEWMRVGGDDYASERIIKKINESMCGRDLKGDE